MLRGKQEVRAGQTLSVGSMAPDCELVDTYFQVKSLSDFNDKPVVLYTFPSIETKKCLESLKRLNKFAKTYSHIHFIAISLDIPFTLNRVIQGYKLTNIHSFSDCRTREVGFSYGHLILDGLLTGMLADSCMIMNQKRSICYVQNLEHLERDLDWQSIEEALKL